MSKPLRFWLVASLAIATWSNTAVNGAVVSLVRESRAVTVSEVAAGAPADGVVHDFFVTTQSDLLSVNGVTIDVPLYQHQFGRDSGLAPAALLEYDASLGVDSFIQTPSDTLILGGGFSDGSNSLWGDLADDGPQQDFLFARLTATEAGTFSGNLAVATEYQFETIPFNFELPALAGLSSLNRAQSLQIEYTPLPPVQLPQPPEPPVSELVDGIPPTIELPPDEPLLPSLPVDEEPPSIDVSPELVENPPSLSPPEFEHAVLPDEIDTGVRTGVVIELMRWLNTVGTLQPNADLTTERFDIDRGGLIHLTEDDATDDLQLIMHGFSASLHLFSTSSLNDALSFRSTAGLFAENSSSIPEPASFALGLMAIVAARGFRRIARKGAAVRPR